MANYDFCKTSEAAFDRLCIAIPTVGWDVKLKPQKDHGFVIQPSDRNWLVEFNTYERTAYLYVWNGTEEQIFEAIADGMLHVMLYDLKTLEAMAGRDKEWDQFSAKTFTASIRRSVKMMYDNLEPDGV